MAGRYWHFDGHKREGEGKYVSVEATMHFMIPKGNIQLKWASSSGGAREHEFMVVGV